MRKIKKKLPVIFFIVIIVATFSPLVIPEGVTSPWLLGMPRTLWLGILSSLLIAFLTLWMALSVDDSDQGE